MFIAICIEKREIVHFVSFSSNDDAKEYNKKDFLGFYEDEIYIYDMEEREKFKKLKEELEKEGIVFDDFGLDSGFNAYTGDGWCNYNGHQIDWYVKEV